MGGERSQESEPDIAPALARFNQLEELFKRSQLAIQDFDKAILHEYRYFGRALVDFYQADSSSKKWDAFERCQHALSCAYNDIIDYLHSFCARMVDESRKNYPSKWASILQKYGYANFFETEQAIRELIAGSRRQRGGRFQQYVDFVEGDHFRKLLGFVESWRSISYELGASPESIHEAHLNEVYAALGHVGESIGHSGSTFEVHYQPKHTKKENGAWLLIGAEALIRLRLSDGTLLMPDQFLSEISSSNTGLGMQIDLQTLRSAIEFRQRLIRDSLVDRSFSISVNFMPKDIYYGHFSREVGTEFESLGDDPGMMIEIAEQWMDKGVALDEPTPRNEPAPDTVVAKVRYEIERMPPNVRISIDDFGAGSTQFKYLADLDHVSELKIDKEIVDMLRTRRSSQGEGLIKGICQMAFALEPQLDVVAEGVETRAQLKKVAACGVKTVQGYVFSRPLSAEKFVNYAKDNSVWKCQ